MSIQVYSQMDNKTVAFEMARTEYDFRFVFLTQSKAAGAACSFLRAFKQAKQDSDSKGPRIVEQS